MSVAEELVRAEHRPSWATSKPQVWYDGWRGKDRVCRYQGQCVICGRRTYAFDDGENDPRGVLGDHAASPLTAEEFDLVGDDVPLCFPHANEEGPYFRAVEIGKRRWTPKTTD